MGRLLGVPLLLYPSSWPNIINAEILIHNNKGHSISRTQVPERSRVTRGTRPGTTGHYHHRLGALAQTIGVTSSPERSYTPLAAYTKRVPHVAHVRKTCATRPRPRLAQEVPSSAHFEWCSQLSLFGRYRASHLKWSDFHVGGARVQVRGVHVRFNRPISGISHVVRDMSVHNILQHFPNLTWKFSATSLLVFFTSNPH